MTEENDKFINEAVSIYVRDNMPMIRKKKGGMERLQCEFCGSKHGQYEEFCDLKLDSTDANTLEGALKVTIKEIQDKIEHPRDLVFAVVLKHVNEPNYQHFKSQYVAFEEEKSEDGDETKSDLNLDSCFKNYSEEETLTGDDRWYCRTCKEHRDIDKKLELYKAPKILILQLKRF